MLKPFSDLQTLKNVPPRQLTPNHLRDLLHLVDELQEAALVGQLDEAGYEMLDGLNDIYYTLGETISVMEQRLHSTWND